MAKHIGRPLINGLGTYIRFSVRMDELMYRRLVKRAQKNRSNITHEIRQMLELAESTEKANEPNTAEPEVVAG